MRPSPVVVDSAISYLLQSSIQTGIQTNDQHHCMWGARGRDPLPEASRPTAGYLCLSLSSTIVRMALSVYTLAVVPFAAASCEVPSEVKSSQVKSNHAMRGLKPNKHDTL